MIIKSVPQESVFKKENGKGEHKEGPSRGYIKKGKESMTINRVPQESVFKRGKEQ